MRTTISDIANSLGISKSTVSQYLNGRYSFMSKETQNKIRSAIEDLDYVPNEIARSLTHKKSNTVGIIVSDIASKFTIDLIRGVERELEKNNIQLLLCNTDNNPSRERQYLISLSARQVDGIILFPNSENTKVYQELSNNRFPLVFVDRYIDDLNIPSITIDNEFATQLATQKMIDNGITNIALITFMYKKSGMSNRLGRVTGYLKTLESNGIKYGDKYIFETHDEDVEKNVTEIILNKSIEGIILTNDILLERFLFVAKRLYISIPQNISVISIDDASFARFHTPAISTIKQPSNEIGAKSARLLMELISGKYKELSDLKGLSYEFDPELISRESIKGN